MSSLPASAFLGSEQDYRANTFFAVFRHYPEWQWNQLSTAYITSPRLTLDEAVIDTPALNNEEPKRHLL